MRKLVAILALTTVASATAYARPAYKSMLALSGLNFGAPTVNDANTNVVGPQLGEIVFDSSVGTNGSLMVYDASNSFVPVGTGATFVAPSVRKFTTVGTGTYTTPSSPRPLYIRVRMVGGGGGGAGSGVSPGGTSPTAGGASYFGPSASPSFLTANGGAAGLYAGNGSAGGSASIDASLTGTAMSGNGSSGGWGMTPTGIYSIGGIGGAGAFGGAPEANRLAGVNAQANSGSGGGGAGVSNTANTSCGGGGGAGGFVDVIIPSPLSSYQYTVGAKGTGGGAGTSGWAGGDGGSGYIEVTEYYQ